MDISMIQARDNNLKLIAEFRTAAGDLADIDGAHTVQSSNPAIASLMSQDDSTQSHQVMYELHPVAGQAILSGSADADLGDGVRTLSWEFELNVMANEAQGVTVSIGELVPKVPA